MHRPFGWIALALLLGGCDAPAAPRPAPSTGRSIDKAALYGDPSLVPTRAGERAREELGLAQAIARALELLAGVEQARVDVELPRRGVDAPARVLAVLRRRSADDPAPLRARARRIATAVVGPDTVVEVIVGSAPPAPSPAPARMPWPLILGVLGLGFFAGTLVERARRIRRTPSRRLER